ncbi:MAG: serine protease [Planctomycetaceae bacterium]|nr:serine protease [Planctomycetaceae bacterium]
MPKNKETPRHAAPIMPLSNSILQKILQKMVLWLIVCSVCLLDVCAEEFGISRRPPAELPQPSQQQVLPYVVRIIAFDASGQSFGTGSYIGTYGEYGVVLTNHHVVCETGNDRLVHVHFPSGFSSFGAVVKTDLVWDLALVAISKPPASIPTLPIARTPSKPGEPLWIVGFGSGLYRIAKGQCVRYLAPPENPKNGTVPLYEIMEVSVHARKGDSGGPILNQRGELAGVLFGSDMVQNTAGSYSERVNRFLMETRSNMAGLPSSPEMCFASIEKEGPVFSLQESRYAVPQNTNTVAPLHPGLSSSSAPFGSGSSSRQYVPPTPIPEANLKF